MTPKPFGTDLTVSYDAQADSYTVTDGAVSSTFPASSYVDGESTDAFDVYDLDYIDQGDEVLTLFRPGSDEVLNLTYVTYGIWHASESATQEDFRFVVGGVQTPAADMPLTGSATYSGVADGLALVDGAPYGLFGSTGTLSANFATGEVSTSLTLRGNPNPGEDNYLSNPGTTNLGTLTGTGTIGAASNTYTGTLSGAGLSGSLDGAFFGPDASETGYSFEASGGDDLVVGVFVGKKD